MLRAVWVLVLLLVLGGVVASGMRGDWTSAHVGFGAAAAGLVVLALMPTKKSRQPVSVGSRGR